MISRILVPPRPSAQLARQSGLPLIKALGLVVKVQRKSILRHRCDIVMGESTPRLIRTALCLYADRQ